jgi:membrane peptidoglycan carboxypeptidase
MLKAAYTTGTARAARRWCPHVHAAAKTGTSDHCRDAWLAGYTSRLATVVWVGRDDNGPLPGTASRVAAPLWGRFMAATR